MFEILKRYTNWLHTRWPAGTVEKLPVSDESGRTNVPGVRIVGDLSGIPLLKIASRTGAAAVRDMLEEPGFPNRKEDDLLDIAIIGGGVSGISAAIEARKANLRFAVFESSEPFSTIVNFPARKPIYTYPTDLALNAGLQVSAKVKEDLVEEIEDQRQAEAIEVVAARIERVTQEGGNLSLRDGPEIVARARRVLVAIGRSGDYRRLGRPGENLDKVYNRLHDPKDYAGKQALVVGGGDTALETAIALAEAGAKVTLSYRGREFSRAKAENVAGVEKYARAGTITLLLASSVVRIEPKAVTLQDRRQDTREFTIPNDVVFTMLGREAPLDFFRRSGIAIRGVWSARTWISFLGFFAFCWFLFLWKGGTQLNLLFQQRHWFPYNLADVARRLSTDPSTLLGILAIDLTQPGFYYSLAYTLLVGVFGWRRIRRRRTAYVRAQTLTLIAIQALPLFFLPYIVLPWMGHNGWFDSGWWQYAADQLFPRINYEHGREYWRSFGFILAWPLFIWNVFTAQPLWWWLAISFLQTFVLIPLMLYRWGKGAYCGWICSCGGLAETLGDTHRHKMLHGPVWNRVNMLGQAVLLAAFLLLGLRMVSWVWPQSAPGRKAGEWFGGLLTGWSALGVQLNYYHVVDIFLAGIIGVGLYFWFSGRVWCRFACPLAALMHIYTRFSKYRIFADKKKCISCNVCTAVCHQGIDVMNFANKGLPMEDPQCVRCSACVQMCPTGVLSFGRYAGRGAVVLDRLPASLVQIQETR